MHGSSRALVPFLLLAACSKSSRDVMFAIDADRARLVQAIEADDLGAVRRLAAGIAALLDRDVVRQRWPEPRYARLLAATRALAQEITQAATRREARGTLTLLEHACQDCHDVYQFEK